LAIYKPKNLETADFSSAAPDAHYKEMDEVAAPNNTKIAPHPHHMPLSGAITVGAVTQSEWHKTPGGGEVPFRTTAYFARIPQRNHGTFGIKVVFSRVEIALLN